MILSNPPHVMVIDDDPAVLRLVTEALRHHQMTVHAFQEGAEALKCLEDPNGPAFDLVLSDINMDGLDGFDVIHRVKALQPKLPVVLMTGQANLDYAIRAMRMGAANLFQKPLTIRELVKSVFHLVSLHRDLRLAEAGLKGLVRETRHFCFRSRDLDIPGLVVHLTDRLVPLGFALPTNVDVIAMAYHEALVNALEHGNLELDSSLKGDLFAPKDEFALLCQARLQDPAYGDRRIEVELVATPEHYTVTIRDEGPGFDTRRVGQVPSDGFLRQCGRGLAMIRMVMDEVCHNERGNEIRMTLRRKAGEA